MSDPVCPEMIGCIEDKRGLVLHVGTSQNNPGVNINRKTFVEAYRTRSRIFVGDVLQSYDAAIQDEIINDNPDLIANLSPHHDSHHHATYIEGP